MNLPCSDGELVETKFERLAFPLPAADDDMAWRGLLDRSVEGGDELDEGRRFQYLVDGFLAAEHFFSVAQQVVLGLIVPSENQNNQAREFAISCVEVDAGI